VILYQWKVVARNNRFKRIEVDCADPNVAYGKCALTPFLEAMSQLVLASSPFLYKVLVIQLEYIQPSSCAGYSTDGSSSNQREQQIVLAAIAVR
jgi:hypothetical protein